MLYKNKGNWEKKIFYPLTKLFTYTHERLLGHPSQIFLLLGIISSYYDGHLLCRRNRHITENYLWTLWQQWLARNKHKKLVV